MVLDGVSQRYIKCPDGKMRISTGDDPNSRFIYTKTNFSGEKRRVIDYDKSKGVLSLDISKKNLEEMLRKISHIPEKRINLAISDEFGSYYFPNIRNIKSLHKKGPYEGILIKIVREQSFLDKIKSYLVKL